MKQPRNFWHTLSLLLLFGAAGYLSRRYSSYLLYPIRKRTGDALWASCIFMLIALIRPQLVDVENGGLRPGDCVHD